MATVTGDQDHSLYVGDLHKDVTERILYEVFKTYGAIAGVNVCRNSYSKESLGYAYVNFVEREHAQDAKNALNYNPIHGKPCRIMWVNKNPESRRSGKGNIIIRNLHPGITNRDLYETFIQLGEILSCKVACNPDGTSRSYGYVHFKNEEDAESAIEKVNGQQLIDQTVSVSKFIPRREREAFQATSWKNIFVKDLPTSVDDVKLNELFSEFGDVLSPKVMVNKEGVSRGFGFVSFAEHEAAVNAVTNMHGKEIDGKVLYVARAMKKAERLAFLKKQHEQRKRELQKKFQGKNLYIKNLDDNVTEEDLIAAFGEYGDITSCAIMKDDKGFSKGFGFVCYDSKENAQRAIEGMRNRTLPGCTKLLFVALHEPREQRKRRMIAAKNRKRQMGAYGAVPVMYTQPRNYYPGHYVVQNRQPPMAQPQPQPQIQPAAQLVSFNQLEDMNEEDRKTTLGEALYQKVYQVNPKFAQKITGMFLNAEWPLAQKYTLLTNEMALAEAIDRALQVLTQQPGP